MIITRSSTHIMDTPASPEIAATPAATTPVKPTLEQWVASGFDANDYPASWRTTKTTVNPDSRPGGVWKPRIAGT